MQYNLKKTTNLKRSEEALYNHILFIMNLSTINRCVAYKGNRLHCGIMSYLFVLGFLLSVPLEYAEANDLNPALYITHQKILSGESSQNRINKISKQQEVLFGEYRTVTTQTDILSVYNKQLNEQITHQLTQLDEMRVSISQAKVMARQILPLLKRMIDSMEAFVIADLPFHIKERTDRIEFLRQNLVRSDISIAEKFRQVLEAYKIEIEYGQKMDSYEYRITLPNLGEKEVDILRIGRIVLLCQTKDGLHSGVWNPNLKSWQSLNDSKIQLSILKGLRITRNQAPISLLNIPLFNQGGKS